jgi:hypothetical protein
MDRDLVSETPTRGGRSPEDYFHLVAVPLVLCGIASLQIYRAQFRDQSAWKGGGFGMFATVDSPGARFLKVYLVTPEGRFPVRPPASQRARDVAELRTAPSREKLDALAARWAATPWIDADRFRQRIAPDRSPRADVPSKAGGPSRPPTAPAARKPRRNLRAVEEGDPPPLPGELIEVSAVRAELWRYTFDSRSTELRAAPFLEATATPPRSARPAKAPDRGPSP